MPERLVLSGPRLADGRRVDVRLSAGRIEAVGTPGSLSGPASDAGTRVDLSGYLLLPAPAEPHAHHDTALTGAAPGPPPDGPEELRRRITEAALIQLGHGATAQRSHVRVGDAGGLAALEAALATSRALRGLADLTTVAVAGQLTGLAGADNRAWLRDAAKMGTGALGGCPDLDPDPADYLDTVLRLADEHGRPLDLHTEGDDPAKLTRLASAAGACRFGVAIGPCTGLSRLPAPVATRVADRLAAAGVTVVCLPQGGCGLAPARPWEPAGTPVRLLAAAGVRVAAGGGALRDAANPVGRGDPLEAAFLLASRDGCGALDAYGAVSGRARAALGLPEVRVEAGFPAELLAVRGESVAGALSQAYSRLVIHRGRIVARTSAVREFCGSPADGGLELPRQATG
ncbi:amidohydrolase family protein [Streptomyces litchfieldiae]|uniref:Hydrolase n=1 Tax=Streptomyces litchfieldiae TaxID=3075543 RepID=A0ABU2MWM5_9ACTN|nr:hydrolase [Streptomyces sp. DSM 44938]MDT0346053.1 hydrolase [Streptomyces sp. DSM 44938]